MPTILELFGIAPPEGREQRGLLGPMPAREEEREQERRALLGEEAEARPAPQLDAERQEKLKALGYIE